MNLPPYYFRLDLDMEDATLFDSLDLSLFRDDGAVVIDGSHGSHGLMIHGQGGGTLKIHSDPNTGPPVPRLRMIYASGCGN